MNINGCNFLGVMFLLKSNVPRFAWHRIAKFDWKIAPMVVASVEVGHAGGVCLDPWGTLCPILLYVKFQRPALLSDHSSVSVRHVFQSGVFDSVVRLQVFQSGVFDSVVT